MHSEQRRRRTVRYAGKAARNGSAFTGVNQHLLCSTDGVAALPVGQRRRGSATAAGGPAALSAQGGQDTTPGKRRQRRASGQRTHVPHRRRAGRWAKPELPTGKWVKTRACAGGHRRCQLASAVITAGPDNMAAPALATDYWQRVAQERAMRTRREWRRLGVRVRRQRAARAAPRAFTIEW